LEEEAEKLKELQKEVEKQMNLSPPPGNAGTVTMPTRRRWRLMSIPSVLAMWITVSWKLMFMAIVQSAVLPCSVTNLVAIPKGLVCIYRVLRQRVNEGFSGFR
jgi:hypothetical protein